MPSKIAVGAVALFGASAIASCAPLEPVEYAQVCDDTKEPDCAPDRKVVVE